MTEPGKNQLLSATMASAVVNYERMSRPTVPLLPTDHVSWMYERIVRSIAKFEEELDQEQEIGARLVTFGNQEVIHIEDVGYWGPDLLIFYGESSEGKPLQLLQHQSQVNVLLVAVPKAGPKSRRIGFDMVKKLEKKDSK